MAKKINPESAKQQVENSAEEKKTENTNEIVGQETGGQEDEEQGMEEIIEPVVLRLLAIFPAYENLYIDTHGGSYTADTPQNLRKEARLYKNPYYKPKTD